MDTIAARGAMLSSDPEAVTEINSQRATPLLRVVAKLCADRGVPGKTQIVCGLGDPQALAYAQSTRLDMVGQRTDRAFTAQGRVGVRS